MASLEDASVSQYSDPFADFVGRLVEEGPKGEAAQELPSS